MRKGRRGDLSHFSEPEWHFSPFRGIREELYSVPHRLACHLLHNCLWKCTYGVDDHFHGTTNTGYFWNVAIDSGNVCEGVGPRACTFTNNDGDAVCCEQHSSFSARAREGATCRLYFIQSDRFLQPDSTRPPRLAPDPDNWGSADPELLRSTSPSARRPCRCCSTRCPGRCGGSRCPQTTASRGAAHVHSPEWPT